MIPSVAYGNVLPNTKNPEEDQLVASSVLPAQVASDDRGLPLPEADFSAPAPMPSSPQMVSDDLQIFDDSEVGYEPQEEDTSLPVFDDEEVAYQPVEADQETGLYNDEEIAYEEPEDSPSLTVDEMRQSPEEMASIRTYMRNRVGAHVDDMDDEELMDKFMTHMRWVSSNEVSTFGEMLNVLHSEDSDKIATSNAYKAYDRLGSLFSNDWDEVGKGLWDYTYSTLTAPSTYIGGIVGGKVAAKGMTTAAKELLMKQAAELALKEGGEQSVRQLTKAAAKRAALTSAVVASGVDATTNSIQDVAYQMTKMDAGAQDEYSPTETSIAALGGLIGGAIGYGSQAARGVGTHGISGLNYAGQRVSAEKVARKETAVKRIVPRIEEAVKNMDKSIKDWGMAVKDGKVLNPDMEDMSAVTSWFYDVKNPDSIFRIIADSGADLDLSDDVRFTDQILDYARALPEEGLKGINEKLEPIGLNFGQILDVVASVQNVGGKTLGSASNAKQYAKGVLEASAKSREVDNAIVRSGVPSLASEVKEADKPQVAKYVASLWRRMLVSHPATSAVNVQGFAQAFGARTLAEILHGGTIGSAGLAAKLFNKDFSDKALLQSKSLFKNQVFKARMLLDPYSSIDAWNDLVNHAPAKYHKQMEQAIFGGIDNKSAAEMFGMNPNNKAVKGAEKIASTAAKLTYVTAQDTMTKTFAGLSQLDKLTRLHYNKSLQQLLDAGEYHLITGDMWTDTMNQMLKDTFSADYTKGKGVLNQMAGAVEKVSNTPYLGFLFPFGRFMNNNIAYAMQYSPIGFLPYASKVFKGKAFEYGALEGATKAMVGTTALASLIKWSQEQRNEGFQWYKQEEADGAVVNRQNMAPVSLYMVSARIGDLIDQGEGVPKELWKDLASQLGIGQWSQEITGDNVLFQTIQALSSANGSDKSMMETMLGGVSKDLASIGAGFTRPLEPLNAFVGEVTGSNIQPDRRANSGLDAVTSELTRYTDAFFAPFFGDYKSEEGASLMNMPKRSATGPEGDIQEPNTLGRMIGRKEEQPIQDIDRLLGMTSIPKYTFDSRTASPEYDSFLNEQVFPVLNNQAHRMLANPIFMALPEFEKTKQVKTMLSEAQALVKNQLESGQIGNADDLHFNAIRKWSIIPEADRTAARREYGIDKPDRELTPNEVEVMSQWIQMNQEFMKYMRKQ